MTTINNAKCTYKENETETEQQQTTNQNSSCLYCLLIVGKNEKNGYGLDPMDIIGTESHK
jgi:hypothetical protein